MWYLLFQKVVKWCIKIEPDNYASQLFEKLGAVPYGIRSVAFPSISTRIYRFSVELAAKIAVKTVKRFLEYKSNYFDLVEWAE